MKKTLYVVVALLVLSTTKAQILNETETKQVFDFLWGSGASANMTVNQQDELKAIFFLNELIKGSCKMSTINGVFDGTISISSSISESVAEIVKAVMKSSYQNCLVDALAEGKFYESVRATLARNFKSGFEIRKQADEW